MTETYTVRYDWDERGITRAVRTQDVTASLTRDDPRGIACGIKSLARKLGCKEVRDYVQYPDGWPMIAFIWRRDEAQQG